MHLCSRTFVMIRDSKTRVARWAIVTRLLDQRVAAMSLSQRRHDLRLICCFCLIWISLQGLGIGQAAPLDERFRLADSNGDEVLSFIEFRAYLKNHSELSRPARELFIQLDVNQDRQLSAEEFARWVSGDKPPTTHAETQPFPIPDPGPGYVLFQRADQPLDDAKIYSAIFHRHAEYYQKFPLPAAIDLKNVPRQYQGRLPLVDPSGSGLELACRATVLIGGGKNEEDFFTGGGVIVGPDGLCVTNYHLAKFFNDGLTVLLADGRATRATALLAANPQQDLALLKLEGSDFPWVPLAKQAPRMADPIRMIHHSENRFFTYDQGYVKRYPLIVGDPWLEISAPFAPGGSGCGIFNQNWELVGLVCVITVGDGPAIAMESMAEDEAESENIGEEANEHSEEQDEFGSDITAIVVRLAVPLSALRNLWTMN